MQIAIGLYDGFTALDVVGPYQVLSVLPDAEVVFCAARRGLVPDDLGLLHLQADATFGEVPRPDVLLVPGGPGTSAVADEREPIVDWVRYAHRHTTWTVSVCTGALLLGAAGVLDGRPAATHWFAYDDLRRYGGAPTGQRVVFDGKVATSAGITAGIDLALALAGRIAGDEFAQAVQLIIEYDPQPPYDTGSPAKAPRALYEQVSELAADVFERADEKVRQRAALVAG